MTPVKTIGVLNIIFGGLLMICSLCLGTYMTLLGSLGPLLERFEEQARAERSVERKERIEDFATQEAEAKTDEEKARIRSDRLTYLARAEIQPPSATMNLNQLGLSDRRVVAYYATDGITGVVLNLLLLISGLGLLRLREWARKLALTVAGLKLARLVAMATWSICLVAPVMADRMASASQRVDAAGGVEKAPIDREEAREAARTMRIISSISSVGMVVVGAIYPIVLLGLLSRPGARAACSAGPALSASDPGRLGVSPRTPQ